MTMRVALDTTACYVTRAGTARYTAGLLRGLRELEIPDLELLESVWPVANFGYQQPWRAIRTVYREFFWAKALAPRRIVRDRIDLYHSAGGVLVAPPEPTKHVVTVCDLAPLRHPERFRPWQLWTGKQQLKRLSTADHIICISRFTADEVRFFLGFPASKLTVVYLGCEFDPDAPPPGTRPGAELPNDEFFLFVGSLEPGKNLALLRETWRLAEGEGHPLPPLVIVGSRWEGVGTEGAPPPNWHYLGRLPDEELVYLYQRALAFVFPTKYEGFGLPVAEAMALRCPVVCSPVASLPEVGGDAVLYTEMSPSAYLKTLRRLAKDTSLREELITKGKAQARKFSWRKCAAETLDVYRDVLKA